jgi:hypothetical protein
VTFDINTLFARKPRGSHDHPYHSIRPAHRQRRALGGL